MLILKTRQSSAVIVTSTYCKDTSAGEALVVYTLESMDPMSSLGLCHQALLAKSLCLTYL